MPSVRTRAIAALLATVIASACGQGGAVDAQQTTAPPQATLSSPPASTSTPFTHVDHEEFPVPDYGALPAEYDFTLECMEWYGFVGEVDTRSGEGLLFDTPPEQSDEFHHALLHCTNSWRELAGLTVGLPDVEELNEIYDGYIVVQRCMEAEGFPVGEMPTRDAFLEGDDDWHPYDAMHDSFRTTGVYDDDLAAEIESTCPAE